MQDKCNIYENFSINIEELNNEIIKLNKFLTS